MWSVCRDEWLLDPEVTFLNHGSYGATPRSVLAEQDRWRERMEMRPTAFMSYELPTALRRAASALAAFLGCGSEDLVFVENTTVGCNAVLNSFRIAAGDEILITDHAYPAIRNAAAHAAGRSGAKLVEAKLPYPLQDPAQIVEAVAGRLGSHTRLVVLDHVTSATATIFPIGKLVALCRAANARILIDGAHAPGMLTLDVPAIGADWYVGNCHKWLMAPKGSGFLWASSEAQVELHPLAISHGYGLGFTAEFDWVGTRDASSWLAVPAALDFHNRLGGASLRERNARLVRDAATQLAEHWGTVRGTPDSLTGSMATVRLPVESVADDEQAQKLRAWLFETHRIEVSVVAVADALWARISAQAYNQLGDYRRLADAISGRTRAAANAASVTAGMWARD
jgi:isopenicillin-N epimerase